jgi:hypothetical protein
VAVGFVLAVGGLLHACGGRAVDDVNGRSGLGEAGGTMGKGGTSTSGSTGVSNTGGTSTQGSGSASAEGGASMAYPGMPPGQAGAGPMPGAAGTPGSVGVGGTTGSRDPMCLGIARGMPCPQEGYMCAPLRCGLADEGSRACLCADGVWNCTSCDFTGSIIEQPPAVTPPPCTTQADEIYCENEWEMCFGAPGGEVCVCYVDDEGLRVWDCDNPPGSWP